MPEDLIHQVET